jgi:hypothetical protein
MSAPSRNLDLKSVALAEALGDVLGVRAVVVKERRPLLWRNVR